MAIRVKHTIMVQIGADTQFNKKLFYIEEDAATVIVDDFLRQYGGGFNIGTSSLESLDLGDISAIKGIYIESDSEVLVRLNGSADAITLRKGTGASVAKLFIEADINAVTVENTDASNEANGVFTVWGDT